MGRAPCCEKVGLRKGRWTAEEDAKLANYIRVNGEGSWRSLPKNAGLLRCGKSCRLRWINYLRADLKRGNISAEEEETIIKLHFSLGNRWSLIAAHLPGRTDNEIKNYWNSHLSRRIHSFRRSNSDETPVIIDLGRIVGMDVRRRRGGRSSRSAMKKKSTMDQWPIAGHDKQRGGDGAAVPTNQCPSVCGGGDCSGTSMAKAIPPDSALCDPAGDPQIAFLGNEEQLGSSELLELWETSEELGSDLFCSGVEMGESLQLGASEDDRCRASGEGTENGGWSAVSSPSDHDRELGATTMSSSRTGEERDGAPTPVSSGLTEFPVDAAGSADEVDVTSAGASCVDQPHDDAGRGECNGAAAVEIWVDTELEDMAAWLWEEAAGEAWPCQWNGEPELQQFSIEEVGALDSWLLSDIL